MELGGNWEESGWNWEKVDETSRKWVDLGGIGRNQEELGELGGNQVNLKSSILLAVICKYIDFKISTWF